MLQPSAPDSNSGDPSASAWSGDGGASDDRLDLGRWLEAARKRWWLPVMLAIIAATASGTWTSRQPRLFRATSSLVIESSTPHVLTGVPEVMPAGQEGWVPDSFFMTEYEVLRSRSTARAAAVRLNLLEDPVHGPTAGVVDPVQRQDILAHTDPADLAWGRYVVEPDRGSTIVRIHVVDTDPKFAAELANAVAEAYEKQNLDRRIGGTRDAGTWLGVQQQELKKKLEDSEDALYRFMLDHDVLNASIESQLDEVHLRIKAFNEQLSVQEAQRIRRTSIMSALEEAKKRPEILDELDEVQATRAIGTIKSRLLEMKAERLELSSRYQDGHPRVKVLDEQMDTLRHALADELKTAVAMQEREAAKIEAAIGGLREAVAGERVREARLNKLVLDYTRLKREVDTNARLYDLVVNRMKEADVTSALPFNNVRLLDRALEPKAPFSPNVPGATLAGFLVGFLLGFALAVALEIFDNTLKTQEEIEKVLAIACLGFMPVIDVPGGRSGDKRQQAVAMRSRDLYIHEHPKSAIAECARFVRTNLLFMSPDAPLKTIAVTSSAPQEGKTTTAITLATAFAQTGSRTIVVDTDLRRPRLHRAFDVESEAGLSNVIVGDQPLEKVIARTSIPNLDVLVCGPQPPNPAEILHTHRFQEIVDELASRYDRVIFDTPPVGPVTDAVVLGSLVDGVIYVAKCEKTTRAMARVAMRSLRDAKVRILGAILNDVDVANVRYSGSYYSYYRRYGRYAYGDDEPAKQVDKEAAE